MYLCFHFLLSFSAKSEAKAAAKAAAREEKEKERMKKWTQSPLSNAKHFWITSFLVTQWNYFLLSEDFDWARSFHPETSCLATWCWRDGIRRAYRCSGSFPSMIGRYVSETPPSSLSNLCLAVPCQRTEIVFVSPALLGRTPRIAQERFFSRKPLLRT